MLFLVIASGALWKTGELTQRLHVTPSVEASVLPAPESPRVPAPETTAFREESGAAQGQGGPAAFAGIFTRRSGTTVPGSRDCDG